jgi:phosphoribosyl 1,2-cyclic phosphodiesterase
MGEVQVWHGEDYLSLGFLFGCKSKVAYVSDVSRFPAETEHFISKQGNGQVDLLILDSLYKRSPHNTHFCLPESLAAVKRLQPKRALFVGMTHEFEHESDNAALAEWSKRYQSIAFKHFFQCTSRMLSIIMKCGC